MFQSEPFPLRCNLIYNNNLLRTVILSTAPSHKGKGHVWETTLKGSGHYWQLLKPIIGIPLKCHSFRERSNFPRIRFQDLRFRTWGLEINHLNAHKFVWQVFFSVIIISQLRRPIELKFSQVCCFMHLLRYTKW